MDKDFNWDGFEKGIKQIMSTLEDHKVFDVESKLKKKACLSTAANLFFMIPGLVLSNMPDKAKECAEFGLMYVNSAREIGDRRDISRMLDPHHAEYSLAYMEYYFNWFTTGVENISLLNDSLEKLMIVVDVFKQQRKLIEYHKLSLQLIIISIKCMRLNTARDQLQILLKNKPLVDKYLVPYDEEQMLNFIVNYLSSGKHDEALVQSIFAIFFKESRNCNYELLKGYLTVTDATEIAFIYYKFFSPDKNILPYDPNKIIRSVRYEN